MPERLALTTSRSTASMCMGVNPAPRHNFGACAPPPLAGEAGRGKPRAPAQVAPPPRPPPHAGEGARAHAHGARNESNPSSLLRHDQILPVVDARDLAGADHRRAIELVEHCGAGEAQADVELVAPIDRAIDGLAIEARAPRRPRGVGESGPGAPEPRHLARR